MKNFLKFLGIFIFALNINTAFAADIGTINEATAMVKKAVAFYKANGKEKTLEEASNNKGQFVDRDLYLSILDLNGKVIGHGVNPRLIGKDTADMKDANGKLFIQEVLEKAKTKGSGQVEYVWPNAVSKELVPKVVYLEKVGDVIIFSGASKT